MTLRGVVLILFFHFQLQGQIRVLDSLPLDVSVSIWNVDELGYLYLLKDRELIKLDTNRKIQFKQSIKSLGYINQIEFINAQKVLLFSMEQQQITLFDNTLTNNGLNLDLTDLGFSNVAFISGSSRPNLIWMYDQFNSSIVLFDIYRKEIVQNISNFKGILQINEEILKIEELENNLYIYTSKELVKLDLNLNLINTFERSSSLATLLEGDLVVDIQNGVLTCFNLMNEANTSISFPIKKPIKILQAGTFIFVQNEDFLYTLKIE